VTWGGLSQVFGSWRIPIPKGDLPVPLLTHGDAPATRILGRTLLNLSSGFSSMSFRTKRSGVRNP
jgi:hypothetical protein